MNSVINALAWAAISLQGLLLLLDGQSRNPLYTTISHAYVHAQFSIDDVAEIIRIVLIVLMLPAALYGKNNMVGKIASFFGFIVYFNISRNIVLFLSLRNFSELAFDLIILGITLGDLIEIMLHEESTKRKSAKLAENVSKSLKEERQDGSQDVKSKESRKKRDQKSQKVNANKKETKKQK